MTDLEHDNAWRRFWNRGGFWRALLAAVVYLALYLGASLLIGQVWGKQVDGKNILATGASVFFGVALPVIVGSVILAVFALSLGWFRPLFARQPIRGSWWMWIAPALVAIAILLRLFGIDYGQYTASAVVLMFVAGIFVGFAEEFLTRGIAVKMLRDSGKSEWVVMVLSSLIFALLHSTNILSGQAPLTVLATVGFTFGFGILMYLTLRVTGNLIWPMIIHALYDPTQFLSTGGIDVAATGAQSPLLLLAGPANIIFVVFAIIALIFVRGRVQKAA
jgi:membrane protease YdiL (CAAX protease family)